MAEKKSQSISSVYEVSGDKLSKKNKTCPKCGAGVFLAEHKDRRSCGKCAYSERK
ncbi:MAG: 30S ribosomal protein S27ae [Candidatus Woesearchaeota archaeon]